MERREIVVELDRAEERTLPDVAHHAWLRDFLVGFYSPALPELVIPETAQIVATEVDARRAVRIVVLRHPSFPVVPRGQQAEVWRHVR